MAGKEPDVGPTAKAVADNVKRLRTDWDWNYTELSDRLRSAAGWSINAVGIRRIESGERRVTPDDLSALAVAFGVSPATLLMPAVRSAEPDDEIELTGVARTLRASQAWLWLTARDTPEEGNVEVFLSFVKRACPSWVSEAILENARAQAERATEELYEQLWPGQGDPGGND